MRIAHISDIHVGLPPDGVLSLLDKRLLGSLNYLLRRRGNVHLEWLETAAERLRALKPDVLVCTGDITSVSAPAEFALAERLLAPLAELCPEGMIYVPGNHDAYVGDQRCREALESTFTLLNGGRWHLDELPIEHRIGKTRFFLVNACLPTGWLFSSGRITTEAMERLHGWLSEPRQTDESRLLIGHFPLFDGRGKALGPRRSLRNAGGLQQALSDGSLDVALTFSEKSMPLSPFIVRTMGIL